MTSLWIGMILLAVVSALFLLWPVLRSERVAALIDAQHNARRQANVEIYKQKLAQLDLDLKEGLIDAERFDELKEEIDEAILEDATDEPKYRWRNPGIPVKVTGVALVLLLGLSSGWWLYGQIGAVPGLNSYFSQKALMEEGQRDFASLLRRLEEAVVANPDDPQGWSLLARVYMDMGRVEEAAEAMGELIRIQGPQPRLLAQKAQALYFADNGRITERVQILIDQALELSPEEPAVLSLLGMNAYHLGQWQEAINYWERALEQNISSGARQSLQEGLSEAYRQLGQTPEPASGPGFWVDLSLSNAANLLTDPRATLFVFVRRAEGGGAPLAATRLTVADLPTRVYLSDQQAMAEDNLLSSATEVVIQARVAMGGTPEAQEGDWQGSTGVLTVDGQQQVELIINQQL